MSERLDDLVHRQQQELSTRNTDELVTLWQQRHAGGLMAEGLEATRRILLERLGYLPLDSGAASTAPRAARPRVAPRNVPQDRSPLDAPGRWLPISTGARIFAWAYLLAGLTAALTQLLRAFNGEGAYTLLAAGLTALQAAFFFLVLQVLVEGVRSPRRS